MTVGQQGTRTSARRVQGNGVEGNGQGRVQFRHLYAPIADELAAVEEILRRELRSRFPFVDALVQHGIRLGGKRMRPALLLLAGQACGQLNDEHVLLAAVVEMIHTATLVHDDVLDEASLRRHVQTVNARFDNEASVLLGDYLFSHAFYLASTVGSTLACQHIGRSTNIVCQGELLQIASRGNFQLSEMQYLRIIDGKTAELCACSCLLGASYAGADEKRQQSLRRFGRRLGIAFQIVDDLLDLLGDEDQTGKSLGSDLEKLKLTLPLIRLLDVADAAECRQVEEIVHLPAPERREALFPLLQRYDALEYARTRASRFAERARKELAKLPESAAREVLESMTEFVIARQH
ncbi:MAG: polyprenyl synthetase family protein [Planctomycetes bacterium]|nr:polyprenyl synthetase family protein [Planctomycetota bacterium]